MTLVQSSLYLWSFLLEVYGHFCYRWHTYGSFIPCKLWCILLQKCFKFSLDVGFEFMAWWFKSIWFHLFWDHFLCFNTACSMGIWIFMRVLILFFINVLYGWFQMSYIFSFVIMWHVCCYSSIPDYWQRVCLWCCGFHSWCLCWDPFLLLILLDCWWSMLFVLWLSGPWFWLE